MPIFEYRCEACETAFEKIHLSRKSQDEVSCPSCRSGNVERLLSTFAAGRSSAPDRCCGGMGREDCTRCETPGACHLG